MVRSGPVQSHTLFPFDLQSIQPQNRLIGAQGLLSQAQVCKNPEPGSEVRHGHPRPASVWGDMKCAGSHLFKELIHEAVSVHSNSDIIIIIAVLGLQRYAHMSGPVVGPLSPTGPETPNCLASIYSRLTGCSSRALTIPSVFLAGIRPGCALSSQPQ